MSIMTDYTLYTEAPGEERSPREMAVYALLKELDIPFIRVDHQPAMTIEDCQAVDEVLGLHICKNLFLCNRQQTDFYLLLLPGKKVFKTKELSAALGISRLSFATKEHLEEHLGLLPGSASILGLMNDPEHTVHLLIDNDLRNDPFLGCHPCMNTSSLKIAWSDIYAKFLPYTGHMPVFVELIGEA